MTFVLFANARSGSTSLANTLAASPDVNLSMEPFHPKYSQWNPNEKDYSKVILSPEDMTEALDEIFRKYNAMKVLKYQFPDEIYTAMLRRKGLKILNLSRRNVFNAALSSLIAQQTNIWQKSDEQKEVTLQPIEVDKIEEIVDYVEEINGTYARFLDKEKPDEHLDLFYEDMFSEDTGENIRLIEQITEFLGIQMPPDSEISKNMVPSSASQKSSELFQEIPNWEEIRKAFASYIGN